jgi:hypothetical protein
LPRLRLIALEKMTGYGIIWSDGHSYYGETGERPGQAGSLVLVFFWEREKDMIKGKKQSFIYVLVFPLLLFSASLGWLRSNPLMMGRAASRLPMNCTLIVPPHPLTAQGLATPYQLRATNPQEGACHEANPQQAAFVQAAILDPATGQISVYNPLVIDTGSVPAIPPVVPTLPAHAVVGIWFGFNGNVLTLAPSPADTDVLRDAACVDGLMQMAYCHAVAFFAAANQAINEGLLIVPPPGVGKDHLPCPTTRDFAVVDQDPSDNVTTHYLVFPDGQTAQDTAANQTQLQGSQAIANGSDNALLQAIDAALGCIPNLAPDLANAGMPTSALPLDELSAAQYQGAPRALVPALDPMVTTQGHPDRRKLVLYRQGVDQSPWASASTRDFCWEMAHIAPRRLLADQMLLQAAPSFDPAVGSNLFTFLAARFVTSYQMLTCQTLLQRPSPITVTTNAQGVAVDATIAIVV